MSWERTPWLVGGGAEHTAEVARLLAHAGTGGAEGVVTPGDLKVKPLSVPGGKVSIAPGAVLVANRYPGGQQQTYVGRNTAQFDVSVTATGSSGGRTDLVVARVLDPQYEGSAPPDPNEFDYMRTEVIEGVPSGTVSARDLNLNYPVVALARIDLPASTGTIQSSHITDVRVMAQPRKERHLIAHALVSGDGDMQLTNTTSQPWPKNDAISNAQQWYVRIPEWAQRMRLIGMWGGVFIKSSSAQNTYGNVWVQIAPNTDPDYVEAQHTRWDTSSYVDTVRETWLSADNRTVPEGLRGRTVQVYLMGKILGGTGISRPMLNATSAVTLDIEFYETAV